MGGFSVTEPGGGIQAQGPSITAPAGASTDPQVQEAVDRTVAVADFGPEPHSAAAYQISETMNDPSLTQDQKDAYVATLVEMANDGSIPSRQADAINRAFNEIGNAYSGENTPELRRQVADAIGHGVADGRLGSDEIYRLVNAPGAAGARELLTGVRDGGVLADVSQRLLTDARREGYDINRFESGPALLTAATDIANMASANGYTSAADKVLDEIDQVMEAGPVAGDMTLVQAMMATSLGGLANLPERDGFHALAGLLNASGATPGNEEAQDRLFATLVRSGTDGYAGGIDQAGDLSAGLDELGVYFERNAGRLVEADWRMTSTDNYREGLISAFTEKVMLHDDYGRADQTAEALSGYIADQAEIVGDPDAAMDERKDAARGMGTLLGSLEQAGARHVEAAGDRAEDGLGVLRKVIDLAGDKIAGKAGPAGSLAYNTTLGAIADALEGAARDAAQGTVDDAVGEPVEALEAVREAMSELDGDILDAFDQRAGQFGETNANASEPEPAW